MIEVFTKAIVREIGRNIGKTASNGLLGDSHSTPYRRVSSTIRNSNSEALLGASSGGYKYDNHLDRLIRTFQIKGKTATFNSAQNIYNEYFELVEEANADNYFSSSETIYLIQQYYRTIEILKTISDALKEMGAKDKSQIVIGKIISMNEFMKELDNNFETPSLDKKEINKKSLIISKVFASVALLLTFYLVAVLVSKTLYLSTTFKIILIGVAILSYIFMWVYSSLHSQEKNRVLLYNRKIELSKQLQDQITKAVNSISVSKVQSDDSSDSN